MSSLSLVKLQNVALLGHCDQIHLGAPAAASRGAEATSLHSLSFSTSGVKKGRRGCCQTDWLGTSVICTDFLRWTPHIVSKILDSPEPVGRPVQGSSARPGVDRCSRLTCPLVWGALSAISLDSFATENWSTLAPEREAKRVCKACYVHVLQPWWDSEHRMY